MKQSLIYVAVLLLSLCSTASAKKKTDNPETVKLKNKIENVMLKVDAQPDWLYSRLQMFWNTHATDVFINGERFDHPGGERAAEPTVKYNGTRGTESQYNRPRLEDMVPYDDDEQGNVTYINKVTGKMEKTSPAKTKFVTKIEDEKVIEAMNGQRKDNHDNVDEGRHRPCVDKRDEGDKRVAPKRGQHLETDVWRICTDTRPLQRDDYPPYEGWLQRHQVWLCSDRFAGVDNMAASRRAQVCRPPHNGRHSRRISSYGMEPHLPQPHDSGRNRRQRGRPAQCI